MPNVKFRASGRTLSSHAGFSLIGQCLETTGIDSIDGRFPTTRGVRANDVVKSRLGLLCLGMSTLYAIENFEVVPKFLPAAFIAGALYHAAHAR